MLSTLVGWYLLTIGLLLLFRTDHVRSVLADLIAHQASFFTLALLMFVFGMMMVMTHNVWVYDWPVAVTLFSWIILLKGLGRLFFPEYCIKWIHGKCGKIQTLKLSGLIYILVGVWILYQVQPLAHLIFLK
jgi:hypothetical protein